MSLPRPLAFCFAPRCTKFTPRLKSGACATCRSRDRRAKRRVKAARLGTPLVDHGNLRTLAWDLWSVWIRARASGCEMCRTPLPPEQLQAAHGITRMRRWIMFHEDNVFALCSSCHRRHTPENEAWRDWLRERLGAPRYDALRLLSQMRGKVDTNALQLLALNAQERIRVLPGGERRAWAIERATSILKAGGDK